MSKFGWSYPPGCNGTPYDDYPPEECHVCKKELDETQDCFCSPECAAKYTEAQKQEDEAYAELSRLEDDEEARYESDRVYDIMQERGISYYE